MFLQRNGVFCVKGEHLKRPAVLLMALDGGGAVVLEQLQARCPCSVQTAADADGTLNPERVCLGSMCQGLLLQSKDKNVTHLRLSRDAHVQRRLSRGLHAPTQCTRKIRHRLHAQSCEGSLPILTSERRSTSNAAHLMCNQTAWHQAFARP